MNNFTKRQWKNLITDIQNERCILLLGPLLPTIKKGNKWSSLRNEITKILRQQLEEEEISFDQNHSTDLEYIAQRCLEIPFTKDIHFKEDVKNFYEQHKNEIPDIYKKLAKIPFHLIINTSPDDYMRRVLSEKKPNFSYYNYQHTIDIGNIKISKEKPLIYNLAGSFESTKSLVLAETQQVVYMRNIIKGNPPIPNVVLEKLKPASDDANKKDAFNKDLSFIFLGFDYNRWQFKVLLDGLNIHKDAQPISPAQTGFSMLRRTKEYYKNRFKVHFVEDGITEFIEKLNTNYIVNAQVGINHSSIKKIVISVTEEEEEIKVAELMEKMFGEMIKNGKVSVWHRGLLPSGAKKRELIDKYLSEADIILPLLSANYFSNKEIIENDERLIKIKDESLIIPILLSPCDYEESLYKDRDILPRSLEPIDSKTWGSKSYALRNILKEIKPLIQQ